MQNLDSLSAEISRDMLLAGCTTEWRSIAYSVANAESLRLFHYGGSWKLDHDLLDRLLRGLVAEGVIETDAPLGDSLQENARLTSAPAQAGFGAALTADLTRIYSAYLGPLREDELPVFTHPCEMGEVICLGVVLSVCSANFVNFDVIAKSCFVRLRTAVDISPTPELLDRFHQMLMERIQFLQGRGLIEVSEAGTFLASQVAADCPTDKLRIRRQHPRLAA